MFLRDAIGGVSPNYDDDVANSKILDCPDSFLKTGDIADGCEIAKDLKDPAEWGWLQLRKRADDPVKSEHASITKLTAERAGIAGSHIFDPFWVRYATSNTYVASPVRLTKDEGLTPDSSRYFVAQSLAPTLGPGDIIHATRSVSPYEFTQVPDFASSVADWAAGNERCPLAGYYGAYEGPSNDGCHQFAMALGAVNVTHFKPLNRWMWNYYHELAKARMGECRPLVAAISSYTTNWIYDNLYDFDPFSIYATEAHECAREAWLYEMWAQHFLQDAWSTGHMWYRWGKASITDVDYLLDGENREDVPPLNQAPRRAIIAGMVSSISGMVHGAKALAVKVLEKNPNLAKVFDNPRLVDDPLNGPFYFVDDKPVHIEWWMQGATYNGGGDLFWRPASNRSGSVYDDADFAEQRQRLLNCGAKSLLEIYRASQSLAADLFGAEEPTDLGGALDTITLQDNYCWGQLATNDSMLHSIGVSSAVYGKNTDDSLVWYANTLVRPTLVGFSSFPRGKKDKYPNDPGMQARVKDRDAFSSRLDKLFKHDLDQLREKYEANAAKSPKGTDSALGRTIDKDGKKRPITMLGIPPFPDTPDNAPPETVPYVDRLISQHAEDPPSELDVATSRVFWRGNIKQTCLESLQDDASLLLDLREQCLDAAETTGNPDACSECTYRAEALMPECGSISGGPVRNSKCSALGVYDVNRPPPGLPNWWFDSVARFSGRLPGEPQDGGWVCAPPFYSAMQWCTGTKLAITSANDVLNPFVITGADLKTGVPCNGGTFYPGLREIRNAGLLLEPMALEKGPLLGTDAIKEQTYRYTNGPWLLPMVTAYHEELDIELAASRPCGFPDVTSSLTSLIQGNVAPANASEYTELYNPGAKIPYCGNTQRATYWMSQNADCETATGVLKTTIRALDTRFQDSGEYVNEYDTKNGKACLVIEGRKFSPTCSDGVATCNAGWQCVYGQSKPFVAAIRPIDQAEADRLEN
jgi:hypothetical protein